MPLFGPVWKELRRFLADRRARRTGAYCIPREDLLDLEKDWAFMSRKELRGAWGLPAILEAPIETTSLDSTGREVLVPKCSYCGREKTTNAPCKGCGAP